MCILKRPSNEIFFAYFSWIKSHQAWDWYLATFHIQFQIEIFDKLPYHLVWRIVTCMIYNGESKLFVTILSFESRINACFITLICDLFNLHRRIFPFILVAQSTMFHTILWFILAEKYLFPWNGGFLYAVAKTPILAGLLPRVNCPI